MPLFANQIDGPFIEMLECCAPLHDIGKVGLPDHILLKPGKLSAEERILMQAHTTIGAETLKDVSKQHGSALVFLQMAIDITRHHHERFDGTGYPDRLLGNAIPLAARVVAICDVYDALRSRRVYKPALSHAATVQLMTEASPGHFDPVLLQIFVQAGSDLNGFFASMRIEARDYFTSPKRKREQTRILVGASVSVSEGDSKKPSLALRAGKFLPARSASEGFCLPAHGSRSRWKRAAADTDRRRYMPGRV